ncbi:MAG: PfkB family carbohydrate kinase [Lachnospiraceae bacterium]|nr:PfkB family carbohydrate kinase [Lachnospiraceae bacterium]
MTKREAQIYEWICHNPLITQEEIAERAGITRSSVGVHISNLMKKGFLAGKGYILSKPGYYLVLGGANIDIGARPNKSLISNDSNPGTVFTSFGGVGRNIAHNMAKMALPVKFISAFGDDLYAEKLFESLNKLGIDFSASLFAHGRSTSTYLYINDQNGDLSLAVADMQIYDLIDKQFLSEKLELINSAKAVYIDTNLTEELLDYLTTNCTVPIFCDPVSCSKAHKIAPFLGKLHTVCPNKAEASAISGIEIVDDKSLKEAAEKMIKTGLKRVFITLGPEGIFCMDSENSFKLPSIAKKIVNTSGAGDSFAAALALSFDRGLNLLDTAKVGLAAAAICCESESTINELICEDEILSRAGLNQK